MSRPPEWLPWVPAVVHAAFAAAVLAGVVFEAVRYVRAGRLVRPMWRRAWRIRWTWPQAARRVGLVHTERSSPPWWSSAKPGTSATKQLVPPIRVRADRWGVHIDAATVGRLGLVEFQNSARHLADAWRVPTVRVTQPKAGVVRLRALVVDPLTEPLEWTDTELAGDVATWVAGIDQDGQPVTIKAADVSGIVVAGLAGYGKTVFLNAPASEPSPRVRRCSSC